MGREYSEKLRDPRWQRKRLEVFQSADFKCEVCGSGDKTLHAHHRYYEKGKEPWDYPLAVFKCLCEDCHFITTRTKSDLQNTFKLIMNSFDEKSQAEVCYLLDSYLSGEYHNDNGEFILWLG